jgi:hypothetical protein
MLRQTEVSQYDHNWGHWAQEYIVFWVIILCSLERALSEEHTASPSKFEK